MVHDFEIAIEDELKVSLFSGSKPIVLSYKPRVRGLEEIRDIGGEFYHERFEERNGGFKEEDAFAYVGYENSDCQRKLPNLTYFRNLPLNNGSSGVVYASSLGHEHSYDSDFVQEVYEFFNYGAMLISKNDKHKLHVCQRGDKVKVPSKCVMTILNLSRDNLLTLDMANPERNKSSKDIIRKRGGPAIVFYEEDPSLGIVKMDVNLNYGFKKDSPYVSGEPGKLEFLINDVRHLYAGLLNHRDYLKRFGIDVVEGSPILNKGKEISDASLAGVFERPSKFIDELLGLNI